jgi:hypothetical protein
MHIKNTNILLQMYSIVKSVMKIAKSNSDAESPMDLTLQVADGINLTLRRI